ncbi:hypothetical protein F0L74_15915 [Chitinophaga agrisoli]|uniref:Secreted protein n=1 Tax=Chitinophaga agrisoli TaxID=2607653 RepID=A0A5B2VSZ4_9BACT|nr:hypothetical protein [Chitinophaga agrisoli]KAA2241387.1 hypothetical protein F0L74_15915 [Chitinophaga agrisoli]
MRTNIKCCLLLLAGLLPMLPVCGQGKLKFFNTCAGSSNYRLTRGDTVIIQCDSSLLMNSRNFRIYEAAYKQSKKGNSGELLRSYEALVQQQDTMINNGTRDYAALRLRFDSLANSSIAALDRTSKDIGVVKDSINNVSMQLNQTQVIIGDAIKTVNDERRKSFLNKLYWGIGGLGIGVAVAGIIGLAN